MLLFKIYMHASFVSELPALTSYEVDANWGVRDHKHFLSLSGSKSKSVPDVSVKQYELEMWVSSILPYTLVIISSAANNTLHNASLQTKISYCKQKNVNAAQSRREAFYNLKIHRNLISLSLEVRIFSHLIYTYHKC